MPVDTKTALLNSAERAARIHGYDGFSFADMAKDVGIRKASIHHHFPTKAALSVALIARYHQNFLRICQQIDASHETGGARLSALVNEYRQALRGGTCLCLCVSLSASRESLTPDALDQICRFRRMVTSWIEVAFVIGREDGSISGVRDPSAEAAATLAMLEGAQLAARSQESLILFDSAIKLLTQRF